jgi:hypothetical protein
MSAQFYQKLGFWISLILFIGLAAILVGPQLYFSWQMQAGERQFEKEFIEPLEQDKTGGKTPEQTMDFFIRALEQKDLQLAAAYFFPEDQADELARFQEFQNQGQLESFINEMKQARATWTNEGEDLINNETTRQFQYLVSVKEGESFTTPTGEIIELPVGNLIQIVTFELNPIAQIWKIRSL